MNVIRPIFRVYLLFLLLLCNQLAFSQVTIVGSRSFNLPAAITLTATGDVLLASRGDHQIFRIDTSTQAVELLAGAGIAGFQDSNNPSEARFNGPFDIKIHPDGYYVVADRWNNRIRKIDPATGAVTTLAGTGNPGRVDHADPLQAKLYQPSGLYIDPAGTIFIAEIGSHSIRRIDGATGAVTTIAGGNGPGFLNSEDPLDAKFNMPTHLVKDNNGHLLISDWNNHMVRKMDAQTGAVTTLAGIGTLGFKDDKNPQYALFYHLWEIKVDAANNIFVCDIGNNRIRRIDGQTQEVTTVVGTGQRNNRTAINPLQADLYFPLGLAIDTEGNLLTSTYRPESGRLFKIRKIADMRVQTPCSPDNTPPTVTAALPIVRQTTKATELQINCAAEDDCSEDLPAEASIELPVIAGYQVVRRKRTRNHIVILPDKKRITITSPDPEALWSWFQSSTGIPVVDSQSIVTKETERGWYYRFDQDRKLLLAKVPEINLVCKTTDAAGNDNQVNAYFDFQTDQTAFVNSTTPDQKSEIIIQPEYESTNRKVGIQIYPNPAKETINISFTDEEFAVVREVAVLNPYGQILIQQAVNAVDNPRLSIPLKGRLFTEGIHYLRIKTDHKVLSYPILIKE